MRRRIENPRILLLDSPLEYKKGESQTNVEITDEEDWNTLLKMEEEYVENMCMEIIAYKPDIVITEKGVSDLAQHYFAKANITAFHRLSWRAGAVAELLVLVGLTVIGAVFGLAQHVVTVTFAYKITKTGNMWCAPRAMTGIKNEVVILTGRFFWPISWFPNFSPNFGGFLNH